MARILCEDKVETPAVYFGKQGKGIWKSKEEFSNPYNWSGYVVGQILSKPEYMGHTVNFRSHKQSYNCLLYTSKPKHELDDAADLDEFEFEGPQEETVREEDLESTELTAEEEAEQRRLYEEEQDEPEEMDDGPVQ